MANSKKIEWNAFEHSHKEKGSDWFWAVGIIAVAIAVLAIYFHNFLFALLILIAAFTSILVAHTKPKQLHFQITRRGIQIDEIMYSYSSLESFWVIDEDVNKHDRIFLKSQKLLMPLIVIPFNSDEIDADDIRDYLLDYLDEEELEEPLLQKIMEYLGF